MNTPEARRRRRLRAVAALMLLLPAGAFVRQERREYRDDDGNVTATRSAVLLPWQRLPPIPGDRPGSVTSSASLAFALVTWQSRQAVTLTRVGDEAAAAPSGR